MERDELEQRRFNQEGIGELIETATRLDQLRHDGQGLSVEELRQVATPNSGSPTRLAGSRP